MALWILSGTTRVSRYQKKHSPTYTYRGHQSSLTCFLNHPTITIHGILPVQFTCPTVFFHNLSPSFLWSTSWPISLSSLSSVFCCRARSGYPNGYAVLGNSQGGFPLPNLRFVITYCDQSFPSPWHCLSAAPSLSGWRGGTTVGRRALGRKAVSSIPGRGVAA